MADTPVWDDTPTCEVRIYREGRLVHTELCDSDRAAVEIAARWDEDAAVTIEVDDLTFRHRPGDILEPEPSIPVDADYPESP